MTTSLVLLTLAEALHLAEEVYRGFRRHVPLGEMPLPVFIGINILIYAFAIVTIGLSVAGHQAYVPMAWLFAVAVGINGIGHLGAMVWRKGYFPGGLTAVLLIASSAIVICQLLGMRHGPLSCLTSR
jgi:hypothetical protein